MVTYDGSAAKNEQPLGNSENGQARRKRTIRARLFGHKIRCQSGQHCKIRSAGRVRWTDGTTVTELIQQPDTSQVDVAIVCIGALGGGHRLHQFARLDEVRTVKPLLQKINHLAIGLAKRQASSGQPFFHPVGDVCNCYFTVPGDHDESQPPEWAELTDLLRELNAAFKGIPLAELGAVAGQGMVLAVAGGPHKADAIRHVLRNSRETTWITHLVTDHETARWILEQEHAAAPRPDPALPAAPGP